MKKLKKGDRLWYKARSMPEFMNGTLLCITTEPGKILGLQFDEPVPESLSHLDLDGRGRKGYCTWAHPTEVYNDDEHKELLNRQPPQYEELDELEL